ncbi:hypothetical protein KW798_02340 [Candidatus Parcubacteria bacterium]|nr:hypothetical protein [Candidatus Parcubacteria bacterium]
MARRKPVQKVITKKNSSTLGPILVVGIFVLWAGAAYWASQDHFSNTSLNSEPGLSGASAIEAFSAYIGL